MRHVHFFDATTGIFTGDSFSFPNGREDMVRIPPGCAAFYGHADHLSQRIDLKTGERVDYQPPQPDADHEWNAETKSWNKNIEVVEREQQRAAANQRIAELEVSQLRAMREDRLRPDERDENDGKLPRERLQQIDDEIAELRTALSDGKDTSEP